MIPFCPEDRELRLDIEKIEPLVRGTEIDEIVENQLPDFE